MQKPIPLGEESPGPLCGKCWQGVRNMAKARPSQDWIPEGSTRGRERGPLPDDPCGDAWDTEQSHKMKHRNIHLGESRSHLGKTKRILGKTERIPGKTERILGVGGQRGGNKLQVTPCGVTVAWNDSQDPGQGAFSGLCFFQEDRQRETCAGRYCSFKYLKIIFQTLRRQSDPSIPA